MKEFGQAPKGANQVWSRILALTLAMLLCMGAFSPLAAFASEDTQEPVVGEAGSDPVTVEDDAEEAVELEGPITLGSSLVLFDLEDPGYSHGVTRSGLSRVNYRSYLGNTANYRGQLGSENRQIAYDLLAANLSIVPNPSTISTALKDSADATFTFTPSASLFASFVNNAQNPNYSWNDAWSRSPVPSDQAAYASFSKQMASIYQPAIDAYARDYPEIWWLDIANSRAGSITNTTLYNNGTAVVKLSTITFVLEEYHNNNSPTDEQIIQSEVSRIAAGAKAADTRRAYQLKYVHDELVRLIDYVMYDQTREQNVSGALVDNEAVCEGYAKAFKLVCDALEIPCQLVSGGGGNPNNGGTMEPHMWNYVRVDGAWYAVDVTWDDQPAVAGGVVYDFFLVGSETVDSFSSLGVKFSESHIEDGDFSGSGIYSFPYVKLSPTAYDFNASTGTDENQNDQDNDYNNPNPNPNPGGNGGYVPPSGGSSGGSSSGYRSGGSSRSSSARLDGDRGTSTTTAARATGTVSNGAVTTAQATTAANNAVSSAKSSGSNTATVRFVNPDNQNLSIAAAQAIAKAAADAGLSSIIHSDTVVGNAVQCRLFVDPSKITTAVNLFVSNRTVDISGVKNTFDKYYNNKVVILHTGQSGAYGTTVQIAAKVDLSGMNTGNLVFYSYDKKTNSYVRITEPNYRIDDNGYLRFYTNLGNDIVISDGALVRK